MKSPVRYVIQMSLSHLRKFRGNAYFMRLSDLVIAMCCKRFSDFSKRLEKFLFSGLFGQD